MQRQTKISILMQVSSLLGYGELRLSKRFLKAHSTTWHHTAPMKREAKVAKAEQPHFALKSIGLVRTRILKEKKKENQTTKTHTCLQLEVYNPVWKPLGDHTENLWRSYRKHQNWFSETHIILDHAFNAVFLSKCKADHQWNTTSLFCEYLNVWFLRIIPLFLFRHSLIHTRSAQEQSGNLQPFCIISISSVILL